MCLDMIRMKLQPRSLTRYTHVSQFVADCRLLFRNAYHYNPVRLPHSLTHSLTKKYINIFLIHKSYSVPYRIYAKTIHNSTHSTHKTSLTLLTVSCKSDGLIICGKPL